MKTMSNILKTAMAFLVFFLFWGTSGHATPCKSIPDSPGNRSAFCGSDAKMALIGLAVNVRALPEAGSSASREWVPPTYADLSAFLSRKTQNFNGSPLRLEDDVLSTPSGRVLARLQSEIGRWKQWRQATPAGLKSGSVRPASFSNSPTGRSTESAGAENTENQEEGGTTAAAVEIPESGSLLLLGAGLIGIAGIRRRREIKVNRNK